MENITGVQHIGMPVDDSAATVAFYAQLGFSIAYETLNGTERVAFLKKGDLVIETYENHQAALCDGAWDHIALDVVDIHKAWKEIVEGLGIPSIEGSIQTLPFWKSGVKFFTVQGPNREKIEFSQIL
ncbi:MAG: VOC family protein [Sphaerochaetaceae bacterium]|nr:VOC family protein [Sphaerochaetaceae bacterium]